MLRDGALLPEDDVLPPEDLQSLVSAGAFNESQADFKRLSDSSDSSEYKSDFKRSQSGQEAKYSRLPDKPRVIDIASDPFEIESNRLGDIDRAENMIKRRIYCRNLPYQILGITVMMGVGGYLLYHRFVSYEDFQQYLNIEMGKFEANDRENWNLTVQLKAITPVFESAKNAIHALDELQKWQLGPDSKYRCNNETDWWFQLVGRYLDCGPRLVRFGNVCYDRINDFMPQLCTGYFNGIDWPFTRGHTPGAFAQDACAGVINRGCDALPVYPALTANVSMLQHALDLTNAYRNEHWDFYFNPPGFYDAFGGALNFYLIWTLAGEAAPFVLILMTLLTKVFSDVLGPTCSPCVADERDDQFIRDVFQENKIETKDLVKTQNGEERLAPRSYNLMLKRLNEAKGFPFHCRQAFFMGKKAKGKSPVKLLFTEKTSSLDFIPDIFAWAGIDEGMPKKLQLDEVKKSKKTEETSADVICPSPKPK